MKSLEKDLLNLFIKNIGNNFLIDKENKLAYDFIPIDEESYKIRRWDFTKGVISKNSINLS